MIQEKVDAKSAFSFFPFISTPRQHWNDYHFIGPLHRLYVLQRRNTGTGEGMGL
jgi:hypothetical protein